MSHYTSIKTKYSNQETFNKVLDNLNYPYVEHKGKKNFNSIEVFTLPSNSNLGMSASIKGNNYYLDFLSFRWNGSSYDLITDLGSWAQKEYTSMHLKRIELNYSYSETITQAFNLGFTRSKILTKNKNNTTFIFQRYLHINRS